MTGWNVQTEKATIDAEALQSRMHGVIQCMLSHILDHGRRGKLHVFWEALWGAVERDVMSFGADSNIGEPPDYQPSFFFPCSDPRGCCPALMIQH